MLNQLDKFLLSINDTKKSNGEVFTPTKITNSMLSLLDNEYFKNPHLTWFENSAGMGHMVDILIKRLMCGLKDWEQDEEKRYKHIVENMLYMAELNEINCYFLNKIIGKDKYKLNIFLGDYMSNDLVVHMKEEWDICSFDFNLSNPPYNNGLYKKFLIRSLNFSKKLLYVIPSNWTVQITGNKIIQILKNNGLKDVWFLKKNDFQNININTLYLYIDKDYKGDTINVNGINIEKNEKITNHITPIEYNIFNKIKTIKTLDLKKGENKTLNYKNPKETNNIKTIKTEEHCNKMISRLGGGNHEIYWIKNYKHNNVNKIVFPRGTGSYNSITNLKNVKKDIVYNTYISKDIIISNGLVYFEMENEEEYDFYKFYLMRSKFVRFIFLKENFFSEFTKGFSHFIPKIDYRKCKPTNNDIYNYFKLNKEEIDTIESYF
jgi:hypothetical protein